MRVVAVAGPGGGGKDTFIYMFTQISKSRVANISSIDPVKKVAMELGWNAEAKTAEDRRFLQDLKKAWIDYNDGPTVYCMRHIRNYAYMCYDYVFVHIREQEEIEKLSSWCNEYSFFKLLILRDSANSHVNSSDRDFDESFFDEVIRNHNGLESLSDHALRLHEKLKVWDSPSVISD
jgi:hypothetical protein